MVTVGGWDWNIVLFDIYSILYIYNNIIILYTHSRFLQRSWAVQRVRFFKNSLFFYYFFSVAWFDYLKSHDLNESKR